MQNQENPYCGAVVIGLGVVMPDPKHPGMFILPGGATCNLQQAERAARKINELQTKRFHNQPEGSNHVV